MVELAYQRISTLPSFLLDIGTLVEIELGEINTSVGGRTLETTQEFFCEEGVSCLVQHLFFVEISSSLALILKSLNLIKIYLTHPFQIRTSLANSYLVAEC